jgi:hypothetical protein
MGMFDKDKVFAPDGLLKDFAPADSNGSAGTKFILWDCEIKDENFVTDIGTTPMTHLTVATLIDPEDKKVVSALGEPIANKVREREEGDLPAICQTRIVETKNEAYSDAFVIQFVESYDPTEGVEA